MSRYLFILLCLFANTALATESVEGLQQLVDERQYGAAIARGELILQGDEKNLQARFLTALAHQMNDNPDQAASLYRELIQQAPQLPEPRNNLAMIYLAKGDYDRASELLVAAINTHPSYATAYDNLSRVYKGIASEAYRRAVSESSEPASYAHDIRLTPIATLDSATVSASSAAVVALNTPVEAEATTAGVPSLVNVANLNTLMIENVRNWATAWSSKNFDAYIGSYQASYRSRFNSRAEWIAHRRSRVLKPGDLSVKVSDFTVRQRNAERVSVDFTQAFRSPSYADRVVKRLDYQRQGSTWKIVSERVLSVL